MTDNKKYFTHQLLRWNKTVNDRPMPWKGEKDPYKIWLSEIILQQTRVEQGWNYYDRFVAAFPTVQHLAKASETKIFKLWEGLGYYTRCKNLIVTAKFIAGERKGKFPDKYEDILALKGIGPYTASAIASFAFNLPHAVVDGNVFRVLSRFFGIDTAIDSTSGKKIFTALANELLDTKAPGIYNQALMDFGAVVCKPKLPLCDGCPLKTKCRAYLNGSINQLPVKEKSIINKPRWFYYLVAEHNGKVYVRKRGKNDIWENLYEFILIETAAALTPDELKRHTAVKKIIGRKGSGIINISKHYSQQLTHQTIEGQFIRVKITEPLASATYRPVSARSLSTLPFPRFITRYLSENPE